MPTQSEVSGSCRGMPAVEVPAAVNRPSPRISDGALILLRAGQS